MKIKKHLQIDAITNSTGRLPSDMENLKVYHHSSSTGEPINVGAMDLTYLIRAYAKCQKQLLQEVRIDTQTATVKGDVKMFSEIPNDASGRAFVAQLKEYLNTESYSVRVRGQYLNDATKQAEGWRPYSYGQPISKSKCLRVYVDTK